jgi:C4-dicarboxylate transporter DctQ subunit
MHPFLEQAGGWLRRRAENLLAVMLGVMFVSFIIQIVCRYVFNFPVGWSDELSIIMWLWGVLWGAAFVLKDHEEIRFDIVHGAVGARTRRVMGIITGVAIVVLYLLSFKPTFDYVTFMKVQKTAYLKIRFDYLYSIYVLFAAAIIIRYTWLVWNLLRGKEPPAPEAVAVSSGL